MRKIILLPLLMIQMSCVQEMRPIEIEFSVDVNGLQDVHSVGIIGEYQPMSWQRPISLNDEDGDGIYDKTITIQAAYNYSEFKYVLNDSIIELEGQGNRIVEFFDIKSTSYHGIFDIVKKDPNQTVFMH